MFAKIKHLAIISDNYACSAASMKLCSSGM
jgi:hypothetical protein